jgi:hypothetical protein
MPHDEGQSMTTSRGRVPTIARWLTALSLVAVAAMSARGEEEPKMELRTGTWMIRQCTGAGPLLMGCVSGQSNVTQYLVIQPNGLLSSNQ